MPPKAKADPPPPPKPTVDDLRNEIVDILEEYLHVLHEAAEKNPGEHNVEPLRVARQALMLFRPANQV